MSISLEQIDLIRKRAKVSYNDAKEALEKCNNDTVEALIHLENQKKIKGQNTGECTNKFMGFLKDLFRKCNNTKFIISKNNSTLLNLSLLITILLFIIVTPPIFLIGVAVALFTGHKIKFQKENGEDIEVNRVFDNVANNSTEDHTSPKDE